MAQDENRGWYQELVKLKLVRVGMSVEEKMMLDWKDEMMIREWLVL